MSWYNFYKIFSFAFEKNPDEKLKDPKNFNSPGISSIDAPNINNNDNTMGANAYIRVQNEMVDQNTGINRINRYREYDRLVSTCAEIEMAMTVFADEACVAGDTEIATVFHGLTTIEKLAREKQPEDRFPVYCYDFEKQDYTIGWAFYPRLVKRAKVVHIILENGGMESVTEDHRILLKDGRWICAGDIKFGDELMPFYRITPREEISKCKHDQYPRIFTNNKGWITERQMIDEWRLGKDIMKYHYTNVLGKIVSEGVKRGDFKNVGPGFDHTKYERIFRRHGTSLKEFRWLGKNRKSRRVIGMHLGREVDVYDLSVDHYQNFCTKNLVMHNCQKDDDKRVFKIECDNKEIVDELEFLFFNRDMLNMNQRVCWDKFKRLCIKGDAFWELILNPDNPKEGVYRLTDLPPETMYRIETIKGKILEFQQSKEGPDYNVLLKGPVTQLTEPEVTNSPLIRFAPDQIVHIRLGDSRKNFYPYGVSLIEAARVPAYDLKRLEDAMVVYRLVRAPERRVFYIDVGQLAGHRAEAFMERIKDQFRKKKVANTRSPVSGASAVEERTHMAAMDEDIWLPTRPNSNTKIDTLPGAENLGEIDDTVYFRNKLFTALNFPKNYFSLEDPNSTRITLSAQDVKFARMIERLQSAFEDGLWEVADRHLRMRGFPQSIYEGMAIKMTPPSEWRELTRAEVVTGRIGNASNLKGSGLMSDFDILTKFMKYTEDEANEMIARMKIQKIEEVKLQILAQNPQLIIGVPGVGGQEIGTEPGGPNPMLGPPQGPPPEGMAGSPIPNGPPMPPPPQEAVSMMPPADQGEPLPDPTDEDIAKFSLGIEDYETSQDHEDIDYSEIE